MGRPHKIKAELINPDREVVVLNQPLQKPQYLIEANRFLLFAMLALMTVVLVLSSFLLSSSRDLATELKQKQQLEAMSYSLKNPPMSTEVDALKSQLIGVVSSSIESKLKTLEKHIERGRPLTALETIKSLESDVKVLRSYAHPPVVMVEKKPEIVAVNTALVREISQLKNLTYITLSSCGLMFAALIGVWLKGRKRFISQTPDYLEKKS